MLYPNARSPPESPVIDEPTTVPPPATDVRAYMTTLPSYVVPQLFAGENSQHATSPIEIFTLMYVPMRRYYSKTIVNSADTWFELVINRYMSELTLEEQRDSNGVRFVHTPNLLSPSFRKKIETRSYVYPTPINSYT